MNERDEHRAELRGYISGLVLALGLSAIPFGAVALGIVGRGALLWIIGGCALVQVVVHFRLFLHIDLSKSKRDDLQLILFSFLIVVLMAGGTIWILANQHGRMM